MHRNRTCINKGCFMSSEWEGHLYMRNVDAFDMVAKHQAQARRIIAKHTGVAA